MIYFTDAIKEAAEHVESVHEVGEYKNFLYNFFDESWKFDILSSVKNNNALNKMLKWQYKENLDQSAYEL